MLNAYPAGGDVDREIILMQYIVGSSSWRMLRTWRKTMRKCFRFVFFVVVFFFTLFAFFLFVFLFLFLRQWMIEVLSWVLQETRIVLTGWVGWCFKRRNQQVQSPGVYACYKTHSTAMYTEHWERAESRTKSDHLSVRLKSLGSQQEVGLGPGVLSYSCFRKIPRQPSGNSTCTPDTGKAGRWLQTLGLCGDIHKTCPLP